MEKKFDDVLTQKTSHQMVNMALKCLYENKAELPLVLESPGIHLHNNLSENDIRKYVKRHKVSGSTRTDLGRKCRDTSLKRTCRRLGVCFWGYLNDRLSKSNKIPPLQEIILQQGAAPSG